MENCHNRTKKMFENLGKENQSPDIPDVLILDIPEITNSFTNEICSEFNELPDQLLQTEENEDINQQNTLEVPSELHELQDQLLQMEEDINQKNTLEVPNELQHQLLEMEEDENINQKNALEDPDYYMDRETSSDISSDDVEEGNTYSENRIVKRNKRHNVDERKWNKNENKKRRECGDKYYGKRKINGLWNYKIEKEKRSMKGRCNCKKSHIGKTLQCTKLSEAERTQIFNYFWSKLGWEQRRIYVDLLVEKTNTRRIRNRKNETESRREFSWLYYLKLEDDTKFRVCKNMFLNTLGIKEKSVKAWKNTDAKTLEAKLPEVLDEPAETDGDRKELLFQFFRDLPKLESHYCRAKTTKLYLETNWDSKASLYRFYKLWSESHKIKPLSSKVFDTVFSDMNLSLFKPKKDECEKCVSFKTNNLSKDEYALHEIRKNQAREALKIDTVSDHKVFCMDTQAVLLSPKSNVSSLYFKMKLMVHNFTIYDVKTHEGYCFIWHEAAGGVTSNEYSSIIIHFLKKYVFETLSEGQKIILFSDGCTSQNRNATLSNSLLCSAIEKKCCN